MQLPRAILTSFSPAWVVGGGALLVLRTDSAQVEKMNSDSSLEIIHEWYLLKSRKRIGRKLRFTQV